MACRLRDLSRGRCERLTDLVEGEWLLRLPLAVEAAVDGGEAADFLHLARVIVRHTDHELEEEL